MYATPRKGDGKGDFYPSSPAMVIERIIEATERGAVLIRRNRLEEAIREYEAAYRAYDAVAHERRPPPTTKTRLQEARIGLSALGDEIATCLAAAGDHDAAIRFFLRSLATDSYDQAAHLGLVTSAAAVGRHGEARRYYREYIARMEERGAEVASFPGPGRP